MQRAGSVDEHAIDRHRAHLIERHARGHGEPQPFGAGTETFRDLPDAGWGDDGKLGFAMLLRFQSHLDMPHRWIYVRPVGR